MAQTCCSRFNQKTKRIYKRIYSPWSTSLLDILTRATLSHCCKINLRKIKENPHCTSWRKMQEFCELSYIICKKSKKNNTMTIIYGLPRSLQIKGPPWTVAYMERDLVWTASCERNPNKILNCHVVPQLSWASMVLIVEIN